MARVQIPFVVQDDLGNALAGTADVYLRGTTTHANVYAASTGGSPLTQPLTVTEGKILGWVDAGSYDVVATAGTTSWTRSWEAVLYSTGLVGLDALSALTPDKIAWESPAGTDVVELWGDDVQLASPSLAVYATDNFPANNLLDATKWTKRDTSGQNPTFTSGYFSTGHGAYTNDATNNYSYKYQWLTNPRTADREVRMRFFGDFNSNMRQAGLLLSRFSATDSIGVQLNLQGVATPVQLQLGIHAGLDASGSPPATLLNGVNFSAPYANGTSNHWWLVGRKVGNIITAELWIVDPSTVGGTPIQTVSHTLSTSVSTRGSAGTDASNHGTGVNNPVGIAHGLNGNQSTGHKYGEFTLLDKGVATHRRLMAAITPSSGSRFQFPIMDLNPSGQITSPINLQELNTVGLSDAAIDALLTYTAVNGMVVSDPVTKALVVRQNGVWTRLASLVSPSFTGTIGLPIYTTAGRPAPSIGAGKMIFVSDADLGSRFQVSDGTTWRNYNPSIVTTTNTQTGTTYTLALTDAGGAVEMNNAGAMTVTVPPNSAVAFPIGTLIEINRFGAGTLAVAAGVGVTIRSRGGLLSVGNQYGSVSLRKRATDEWVLVGDLA